MKNRNFLHGSHTATIDDKGRLAIPAKHLSAFRELAGAGEDEKVSLVIAISSRGTLAIYPKPVFDEIMEQLLEASIEESDAEYLLQDYANYADEQDLDKQNRLKLPNLQMQNFGLSGEVVVMGSVDFLEIIDRRTWDDRLKERTSSVPYLNEQYKKYVKRSRRQEGKTSEREE